MQIQQPALRSAAKVSLAALVVLLIGAFVFYKERILFADSAFKLFGIIRYGNFSISELRYGSFASQLFPWLGNKLHLPVKTLVMGYSVSFNLFYLLVAWLLVYAFRQYALGSVMALYYFLLVSIAYFWPNDEIHQAVAWMFLFFGVTLYMGARCKQQAWVVIPFVLLAFLSIFTHFIVIVPLFFIWGFLWIERKNWPFSTGMSVSLTFLLAAIIFVKYKVTGDNSYDAPHLTPLLKLSLQDVIDSFRTPVIGSFLHRCLVNYWISVIAFILGIYGMIKARKTALLMWVLLACTGYFILIGVIYPNLTQSEFLFHIETEWQCLGIILAVPFVMYFIPLLKAQHAAVLMIVIFGVRIAYICTGIPAFTWRTQFRTEVLQQMKQKNITKLAIIGDADLRKKQILDWALPEESILDEVMHHNSPQRTFFIVDTGDHALLDAMKDHNFVKLNFTSTSIRDLVNPRFVVDSTRPYTVLTYDELFK